MRRWDGLVVKYARECEARGLMQSTVENRVRELERFGACSIPIEALRDRGRERWRTGARRLALMAWRRFGRQTSELAASLNLSVPSATNLVRRASAEEHRIVLDICAQLAASL